MKLDGNGTDVRRVVRIKKLLQASKKEKIKEKT